MTWHNSPPPKKSQLSLDVKAELLVPPMETSYAYVSPFAVSRRDRHSTPPPATVVVGSYPAAAAAALPCATDRPFVARNKQHEEERKKGRSSSSRSHLVALSRLRLPFLLEAAVPLLRLVQEVGLGGRLPDVGRLHLQHHHHHQPTPNNDIRRRERQPRSSEKGRDGQGSGNGSELHLTTKW